MPRSGTVRPAGRRVLIILLLSAFLVAAPLASSRSAMAVGEDVDASITRLRSGEPALILSKSEVEEQQSFRAHVQLDSSEAHILELAAEPELRALDDLEVWDLPLTPQEFDELDRRAELARAAGALPDLVAANSAPGTFGAMWQSQAEGGAIYVALTSADVGLQRLIRDHFEYPDSLRFVVRDVSSDQINKTYEAAMQHIAAGLYPLIVNVSVDEIQGSVTLLVDSPTDAIEAQLHALFPGDFVNVAVGEPAEVALELRNTPYSPLRGGLALHLSGGPNDGADCTSGFILYRTEPNNAPSTHWMTTAGHCSNNGVRWSQGDFRVINPMEFRGPGGQSDEGVIRIPSSLASSWIYVTDTTRAVLRFVQRSNEDGVDMAVCSSLGNSDRNDCGFIDNRFISFTGNDGFVRTNLRSVRDAQSQGGDSGSPWYLGDTAFGGHVGSLDGGRGNPIYGHVSAMLRELTEQGSGTFSVVRN